MRPHGPARGPVDGFYSKFNGVLEKAGFTESVHRLCEPYYKTGGRPPVDPAVIFKMLIAGFPEGIGSERGIAARCADSLSLIIAKARRTGHPAPDGGRPASFGAALPFFEGAQEHHETGPGISVRGAGENTLRRTGPGTDAELQAFSGFWVFFNRLLNCKLIMITGI